MEATPGYYIGDDNIVYSDSLGRAGLKRISKQITRTFYTPGQLLRSTRKAFGIGLFDSGSIGPLIFGLPFVLANALGRKVSKKIQRSPLLRMVRASSS